MESQRCRASNHTGHPLAKGEDEEDAVEKTDAWEPMERRSPPDGTVVNVGEISRPPWPSIKEVEPVTTA
jgi:hypothetical protein